MKDIGEMVLNMVMVSLSKFFIGTAYYKNGNIHYKGEWEGGEPHGQGTIYSMKGEEIYSGRWVNGKGGRPKKLWKEFR